MTRTIDVRATTFVELAAAELGLRRAINLSFFVQDWADIRTRLGRPILMVEFVRESGRTRSAAYRDLRDFRKVFDRRPGVTPNDLLQLLEEQSPETERALGFRVVPA